MKRADDLSHPWRSRWAFRQWTGPSGASGGAFSNTKTDLVLSGHSCRTRWDLLAVPIRNSGIYGTLAGNDWQKPVRPGKAGSHPVNPSIAGIRGIRRVRSVRKKGALVIKWRHLI